MVILTNKTNNYLISLHIADFGISFGSIVSFEVILDVILGELNPVVLLVALVPPAPTLPRHEHQHGHHAPQEHCQDAHKFL